MQQPTHFHANGTKSASPVENVVPGRRSYQRRNLPVISTHPIDCFNIDSELRRQKLILFSLCEPTRVSKSNCIHAWFIHLVLWIRSTELTCSACSRAILFSFSSTRLILLGDPLSILQSNQGVNPISGLAIASSPHLEVKVQIKSGRLITLRTPHFPSSPTTRQNNVYWWKTIPRCKSMQPPVIHKNWHHQQSSPSWIDHDTHLSALCEVTMALPLLGLLFGIGPVVSLLNIPAIGSLFVTFLTAKGSKPPSSSSLSEENACAFARRSAALIALSCFTASFFFSRSSCI